MAKCMLTTIDNPFNPFEQFNEWFMFDVEKGYNSCGYLSRIARTSDQLTDEENDEEIERAIADDLYGLGRVNPNDGDKLGDFIMPNIDYIIWKESNI